MAVQLRSRKISDLLATTKGKTYTVMVVTVITVVLMFSVAIAPAYISITDQIKSNEAKRQYLAELTQKEANLRTLAEQATKYEEAINKLDSYYANKENDEFILANLSALAERYSLKIGTISFEHDDTGLPVSEIAGPGLKRVGISMNLIGDINAFQQYLTRLDKFPTTITVRSINYGTLEEEAGSNLNPNLYNFVVAAEYFHWTFENE